LTDTQNEDGDDALGDGLWEGYDRTTEARCALPGAVAPLRGPVKGAALRLAALGPVGPPLTGPLRFADFRS
jgi:hypothetical protein